MIELSKMMKYRNPSYIQKIRMNDKTDPDLVGVKFRSFSDAADFFWNNRMVETNKETEKNIRRGRNGYRDTIRYMID